MAEPSPTGPPRPLGPPVASGPPKAVSPLESRPAPQAKPESKPESKPQSKPESKPDSKPASKAESKPKREAKAASKPKEEPKKAEAKDVKEESEKKEKPKEGEAATETTSKVSDKDGAKEASKEAEKKEEKKENAAKEAPSPAEEEAIPLPVAAGSVGRIQGLKAVPELNGQLGQLLRQAEHAPDRMIMRTSLGEKALKHTNVDFSFLATVPMQGLLVVGLLLVLSAAASAESLRSEAKSALGAAACAGLGFAWLAATLSICGFLYLPCRPAGTWVPIFSTVGAHSPAAPIFRLGLLMVGLHLVAVTWMYQDALLTRLPDFQEIAEENELAYQALLASLEVNVSNETGSCQAGDESCAADASSVADSAAATADAELPSEEKKAEAGPDDPSGAEPTEPPADGAEETTTTSTTSTTTTTTMRKPKRPPGPPGPEVAERSVLYGYIGAAGFIGQGIFCLKEDNLRSVSSILHILSGLVFAYGATTHVMESTYLLAYTKTKFLGDSMGLRLRQAITSFGPLMLLAMPMCSQVANWKPPGRDRRSTKSTLANIVEASGLSSSLRGMQWVAVLLYVTYCSSYGVDFWSVLDAAMADALEYDMQ
eukprot:TRINITY_DN5742_c0_g1_i1.p1 TRINITY_DN5742_c0_g1~~TRINITY_DN5742_c0_g1_i1.p1  ORF type:complete len:598 (-),score=183.82 TRINITY_DN5742_c0_g1_i1:57-1850(-)